LEIVKEKDASENSVNCRLSGAKTEDKVNTPSREDKKVKEQGQVRF